MLYRKPSISIIQFFCLSFALLFTASYAEAGLMEVSASYSTRTSLLDENNFSKSESVTGSFSWYFLELSALEVSYTEGTGTLSTQAVGDEVIKYITEMQMIGADIVFSFAGRQSMIQPFVKGGAASVKKKIFRELENGQRDVINETDGYQTVPSWGFGIKINLTQTFSIKGSYDRWRSASEQDKKLWDEAVRAGVSVYF